MDVSGPGLPRNMRYDALKILQIRDCQPNWAQKETDILVS